MPIVRRVLLPQDVEGWMAAWRSGGACLEEEHLAESLGVAWGDSQAEAEACMQAASGCEGGQLAAAHAAEGRNGNGDEPVAQAEMCANAAEQQAAAVAQAAQGGSASEQMLRLVGTTAEQVMLAPPAAAIVRVTEPCMPGVNAARLAAVLAPPPPPPATPQAAALAVAGFLPQAPADAQVACQLASAPAGVAGAAGQQAAATAEVEALLAASPAATPAAAPASASPACAAPTPQEREAAYKARIAAVLAQSKLGAGQGSGGLAGAAAGVQELQAAPATQRAAHLAMRSKVGLGWAGAVTTSEDSPTSC